MKNLVECNITGIENILRARLSKTPVRRNILKKLKRRDTFCVPS